MSWQWSSVQGLIGRALGDKLSLFPSTDAFNCFVSGYRIIRIAGID